MKKRKTSVLLGLLVAGSLVISPMAWSQTDSSYSTGQSMEPRAGRWTVGGGIGFLAETPDDVAVAMNGNADCFINESFSIGPLLQLAFTGDFMQIGFSGQGKYWIDLPNTDGRARMNLQAGIGFVHADFLNDDTSWLIPLGIGLDYALNPKVSLTGTFLLDFTNLDTGAGTGADVMPGVSFGVRF